MAEPQDITRSPNLAVTLLSWAEAGAVTEPSAGRKSTGWLANDLVSKEELNWLDREPYRWLRALFSRYLSSGENLVGSWFVDKGTGIWSDDAVGILEGFLSDGPAGTLSLVTDLWLDPDGTGGVRVQVSVPKASTAVFLATRDTYVFVPIDLIVPPTVSEPELALLDVPVGNPAPAAPAGFVLVWRVETDATGIVDQEILLPDFPVMKQVGFEIVSAALAMVQGDLDVGGNVEIQGDLDVTGTTTCKGAVTLGDAAADAISLLGTTTASEDVTVNAILTVNDTATLTMDVNLGTDQTTFGVFNLNCTLGNSAAYTHTVNGDLTIGATSAETLSINSTLDLVLLAAGGITGASGGNPVDLTEGAILPTGKPFTVNGSVSVVGASGGSLSSDPTAALTWNGPATWNGRFVLKSSQSTAEFDLSVSGDNLRYRDSVGTKIIHKSVNGYFRGHNQVDFAAGAASFTLDTQAVAPKVAGDVDITANLSIQRAIAGDVTISIDEVGGAGQIGVGRIYAAPVVGTSTYLNVTFSRTRVAADTTPRVYRITVAGGGSDVTMGGARIIAEPATG